MANGDPDNPAGQQTARPHGRAITDFANLSTAELALIQACRRGNPCTLGDNLRPPANTPERKIAAALVRFLVLGGDDATPIHEKGIVLNGAWLDGPLDFGDCTVVRPLTLARCRIDKITADDTTLPNLSLDGSLLENGLAGDRLKCPGVLDFSNCTVNGPISLLDARLGLFLANNAELHRSPGTDKSDTATALQLGRARISGDVRLIEGFTAHGTTALIAAEIGGDLACHGGTFNAEPASPQPTKTTTSTVNPAAPAALLCERLRVAGTIFLYEGFVANGPVSFDRASVGIDFNCSGATFANPSGIALSCDGARVASSFSFCDIKDVTGQIVLTSMQVGTLVDDQPSWSKAAERLILDGFTYGRFGGEPATITAAMRSAWLEQQVSAHLKAEFRPQPWEQAIAVLRAMGRIEDAQALAICKQTALGRSGTLTRLQWFAKTLSGVFNRYGYAQWLPLAYLAGLLVLTTALSYRAVHPPHGGAVWLEPASPKPDYVCIAAKAFAARSAPGQSGVCPAPPPDYANFNALFYAMDVLLPVVSLGYKTDWHPLGIWFQSFIVAMTLVGWAGGTALALQLAGVLKKD